MKNRELMNEKTAFDILLEKLTAKGMKPESKILEKSFSVSGRDRMLNTKFIVAMHKSCFFCAYDSYGTSAYSSKTFTGIYSAINLPPETECNIYKKDWLDLFLRTQKRKTGISYIDDSLTITSASKWTPYRLLNSASVHSFLELQESIQPLKITIQYNYLSIIEKLKDKTIIGIETDSWLYKDKDLDLLLDIGRQLIENMTNACT